MSVLGIDIGNENSYIAVARAGGIETIANEYSQRSTPTYVAFGNKTRDLGVSAKNKQVTNVTNTIFDFKRLIGRNYDDTIIQQELMYVPYSTTELHSQVGFKVNYLEEQTVFTAQQIMAMMLTKLKEISESNLRMKVQDCVLSVPIFYTDAERRAVLDAAEIAGLNPLKLMNETTAVALAYGFYKQDLPEDKAKNVVFVDLGQSSLQACACAFTKGKLKVLGCTWNRNLGGRDFDNTLVRHFVADFLNRYKLDVMSNKRAVVRLMQECEKLKKQMSASSLELPMNIECFMDDKDVSGRMKREDFEKLAAHPLQLIECTLKKLLHDTRLKCDDIDSVQIVGGSSRLPAFKALIQSVFGKEPSTTLNQDEAVARGCALQCAMLSPTFKVRDFSITDIQPYPVKLVWQGDKVADSEMEVFPVHHQVPFSKMLTFYRTEPFSIEAYYAEVTSQKPLYVKIGTFTIANVTPTPEGENSKIKVKARINKHGVFSLCSAYMPKLIVAGNGENDAQAEKSSSPKKSKSDDVIESEEDSGANGEVNSTDTIEDSEKTKNDKKEPDQIKNKNVVKQIELPVQSDVPSLSRNELNNLIEKEGHMRTQDKMEKERADAKNAVEEYVYDFRGKLSCEFEEYVTVEEAENIRHMLDETENWLYDEGEDQQKSVYVQKLNALKKVGDPITTRYVEWENRPLVMESLGLNLQLIRKALQSYRAKEERYEHISKEDIMQVQKMWDEQENWYNSTCHIISEFKKNKDPSISYLQIQDRKQELDKAWPILLKPKPKVEPPPPTSSDFPKTEKETSDASGATEKDSNNEHDLDSGNMDVN